MRSRARFSLGTVVATPEAVAAMEQAGQDSTDFLARHIIGDWGDVCDEARAKNEVALVADLRLLSSYRTARGVQNWVITEADRSSTCLLLPEEY